MKRAIRTHRRDFIAIVALVAIAAIAVAGYILEHQPAFTFGQELLLGQGRVRDQRGRHRRAGAVGDDRRRPGRSGRRRPAGERPGRRDDGHLQAVRADLPERDRAAAPAHAAEGHVPVARSGDQAPARSRTGECSASRARSRTSTSTRSSARSTPTRATICCCCCPAAPGAFNDRIAARIPTAVTLRGTFKRFAPLDRDTQTFTTLLVQAQRQPQARDPQPRRVASSLGGVDGQLTSLIESSNTNFQAISSQDAKLEAGAHAAARDAQRRPTRRSARSRGSRRSSAPP